MRPRACLLIAALAWLPAAEALAQPSDPSVAAQEQFRLGREAVKRGDYAAALPLFRKSQELYPTPGTLLNLASCEEKLDLVASARQHFLRAAAELPDSDDRVSFAKQSAAALEPRVPKLRITLAAGAVAGARVLLDEQPVAQASLGADLLADPGKHVIVVSASNLPDRRYEVTLAEGKRTEVTVEPGARGAVGGSSQRQDTGAAGHAPKVSGRRVAGFVIGGVGVVGLGAGAVTGAMALSTKSDLNKKCPVPAACTQEGVDEAHKGKTLSVVSTAAFIAGGVAAGAGLVLVLTGGSGAPEPAAALGVSPLPGGGALRFTGRF